MNRLLMIVLLAISCNGQDYSVTDSLTQAIDIKKVRYLIIECYCNNGVKVVKTNDENITINVKGKLESLGYHGEQKTPKEIGKETLSFKTELKNDTLKLISKEWIFIHHSYLIEKIKIEIPDDVEYEIKKIKYEKLEGREIK